MPNDHRPDDSLHWGDAPECVRRWIVPYPHPLPEWQSDPPLPNHDLRCQALAFLSYEWWSEHHYHYFYYGGFLFYVDFSLQPVVVSVPTCVAVVIVVAVWVCCWASLQSK
jgi:hypothetical protein